MAKNKTIIFLAVVMIFKIKNPAIPYPPHKLYTIGTRLYYSYLSDLNSFLANRNDGLKQFQSLAIEFLNDDRILIFLKIHVLLYADDTVLIGEIHEKLRKTIDTMSKYCEIWKLCINFKKVVIFSRGKAMWGNDDSYSHLSILFNYDGKFSR